MFFSDCRIIEIPSGCDSWPDPKTEKVQSDGPWRREGKKGWLELAVFSM